MRSEKDDRSKIEKYGKSQRTIKQNEFTIIRFSRIFQKTIMLKIFSKHGNDRHTRTIEIKYEF